MIVMLYLVVGNEWCNLKVSPTNLPQTVSSQFEDTPHDVR
jgi:hypothetical protein